MGRIVALAILLLPLIEIALFIVVGRALGVWLTLALVAASAFGGALLLRWLGFAMVNDLRSTVSSRKLPGQRATDALLLSAGALLLIVPGLLTSAVGLVLLLPPVRSLVYRWFAARVEVVDLSTGQYSTQAHREQLTDDTVELDDDEWRPR